MQVYSNLWVDIFTKFMIMTFIKFANLYGMTCMMMLAKFQPISFIGSGEEEFLNKQDYAGSFSFPHLPEGSI